MRCFLIALLIIWNSFGVRSQCVYTAAPAAASITSCSGTLVKNATWMTSGQYYFPSGSTATYAVYLSGATLIVCGNLTFSSSSTYYTGTIVVEKGATLTLNVLSSISYTIINYGTLIINSSSGSELQLNSYIYNYGQLTLNAGIQLPSSSAIINASAKSVLTASARIYLNGGKLVNLGYIDVATLELQSPTVCLQGNSILKVNTLKYNNIGANGITVSGGGTANLEVVSSFVNGSNKSSITSSSSLVVCEHSGVAVTNGVSSSSPYGSATYQKNCSGVVNILVSVLESFGATLEGSVASVSWRTLSEGGMQVFVVQSSTDGVNFQDVQELLPHGVASFYSFQQRVAVRTWYRLALISESGAKTYSAVAVVAPDVAVAVFSILPNVVRSGVLNVQVNMPVMQSGTWVVYDMMGRLVFSRSEVLNKGGNSVALPVGGLGNGLYKLLFTGASMRVGPGSFMVMH